MTIAELCLPAAVMLAIASIVPAKLDGRREYDNANPRDPRFYAPGLRARAQGAHLNGYEAFPFFAAAVILAEMRGAPQGTLDALAVGFILVRIAYVLLYLGNHPRARSLAWAVGLVCNMAIFFAPAWAGHGWLGFWTLFFRCPPILCNGNSRTHCKPWHLSMDMGNRTRRWSDTGG